MNDNRMRITQTLNAIDGLPPKAMTE